MKYILVKDVFTNVILIIPIFSDRSKNLVPTQIMDASLHIKFNKPLNIQMNMELFKFV